MKVKCKYIPSPGIAIIYIFLSENPVLLFIHQFDLDFIPYNDKFMQSLYFTFKNES